MAKNKEKKEEPVLTEWQKRNLEFLKKKQAQKLEKDKLDEKRLAEKRAQLEEMKSFEKEETLEDEGKETSSAKDDKEASEEKSQAKKVKSSQLDEGKEKLPKKEAKPKKERQIPPSQIWQAVAVLSLSVLVLLVAVFFISPYSRQKALTVSGNTNANQAELLDQTGIKASDYITTIFWHRNAYAKVVANKNQWVKKADLVYEFPNRFILKVTEYRVIAYSQTAQGYVPILENGRRLETVNATELPSSYLVINLENEADIQSLIKQLSALNQDLVSQIKTISSANSSSTKDLLSIEMTDGNTVRVPLSELEKKLPYYSKIKDSLTGGQIVDMEVGIYSTNAAIEASIAASRTSTEETSSETSADPNASSQSETVSDNSQTVTEATTSQVSE
ncbi:cell division protein FtsQ/DivIB [Streptococcus ferus]|uniref:cell division protein FtsQ/DivIB n=1 Tax=Streptococcus ferus TaxID=1345 RepID=UPI0035118640